MVLHSTALRVVPMLQIPSILYDAAASTKFSLACPVFVCEMYDMTVGITTMQEVVPDISEGMRLAVPLFLLNGVPGRMTSIRKGNVSEM